MRPHGYARYRLDGCRCYTCGYARAEYDDRRNRLIAYGRWQPFVALEETQHRIHDLNALGFGDRTIAALAGLGRKAVRDIRTGVRHDPGRGNPPLTQIRTDTAAAIAAIPFDPLEAAPGTYVDATLTWTRIHALIRAGYPRSWIAHQLGRKTPALQLRADRVTVANARAIRDLLHHVGHRPGPSKRAQAEGIANDWPLIADLLDTPRTTQPTSRHVVPATEILAAVTKAEAHDLAGSL